MLFLLGSLAASLFLYLLFYLIGSLELRGKSETWLRAFAGVTILIAGATVLLSYPLVTDPLDGQIWLLPLLIGLTALLAVITLLDLETQMLSDGLTIILGLGGLSYSWLMSETPADNLQSIGLGIALGLLGAFFAGPYSKWRKRDMLGWGDVKFFAAAGFWMIPAQLPIFLIIAGGIGAINALIYRLATGRAETPFAPALCIALWLCVVFGLSL